jgi:transposase
VICLDEMGPESAKSFPGPRLVRSNPNGERRGRARQEIDYGRRGGGYVFGAFVPVTGAALTASYPRRTTANVVAFLQRVEGWLDPSIDRVYVVLDNLAAHRAPDVLLWALVHPRWEFVFQPRYAAYLNLIEPWWKVLRSLALTGRRFETWEQLCAAVDRATQYWNAHRHPFVWGRRKRRRSARPSGIARLPIAAQTYRMDHLAWSGKSW